MCILQVKSSLPESSRAVQNQGSSGDKKGEDSEGTSGRFELVILVLLYSNSNSVLCSPSSSQLECSRCFARLHCKYT